jgi:hypothetical protein
LCPDFWSPLVFASDHRHSNWLSEHSIWKSCKDKKVQGWGTSSTDPGACHLLQQLPSTEEHDKNEQWESCPPGGQQCGMNRVTS